MVFFDKTLMCIPEMLSKEEARIFAFFLIAEKFRHKADIRVIEKTLEDLSLRFGLDLKELEREVLRRAGLLEEITPGGGR